MLKETTYEEVESLNTLKTSLLKKVPYYYFYDGTRIYHTRTNVVADVVIWSKTDQIALLESSPRGACPFPEDLYEALICGALSYLFKENFNNQQFQAYRQYFLATLERLDAS